MMVAVLLGALSLGACVDDNESASVTNIRDAKAQQLLALAEKAKLEGEAAKIAAEAEKAMADAKAAYLNEKTEEAKQEFAVKLEEIKAWAEASIKEAQLKAQQYEQQMLREANQQVRDAYDAYQTELNDLNDLRDQKLDKEYELAKYEAGLGSTQAYVDAMAVEKQSQIDRLNNQIEAWKTYSGLDKSELMAERSILKQNYQSASQQEAVAENTKEAAKTTVDDLLNAYDIDKLNGETSSVKAVAAVQKFKEETSMGRIGWVFSPSEYYNLSILGDVKTEKYDADYDGYKESYLISNAFIVNQGGITYAVNPICETFIDLSEEVSDLSVKQYTLDNRSKTLMEQYFSNKEVLEEELGSDVAPVSGMYEELADLEEAEKAAQKAYTDAQAEYDKLEASLATVTDKVEESEKNIEALRKTADEVATAQQKIIDAANKVINDPDADEVEKAQAIVDKDAAEKAIAAANKNVTDAEDDLEKLIADNAKDMERFNELNNTDESSEEYEKSLAYLKIQAEKATYAVASQKDAIEDKKQEIEEFDTNATLWNNVVAALESEEYTKAIAGMKENTDVLAYVKACNDHKAAKDLTQEVNDKITAINNLINEAYDAEEMIASLTKQREEVQLQLDELEYSKLDMENGLISESLANREKVIAMLKSDIENLDAQITAQEKVVEIYKAALETAINSDLDEETPSEPETPEEGGEAAA